MELDFRKKKKVSHEELADDDSCKKFEEDAQTYYKSLRARSDKERALKEIQKKKLSKEEQKKKKERQEYCKQIKAIYREKLNNKV
jgi:Skp family chaperone for outer membrane proteins